MAVSGRVEPVLLRVMLLSSFTPDMLYVHGLRIHAYTYNLKRLVPFRR